MAVAEGHGMLEIFHCRSSIVEGAKEKWGACALLEQVLEVESLLFRSTSACGSAMTGTPPASNRRPERHGSAGTLRNKRGEGVI